MEIISLSHLRCILNLDVLAVQDFPFSVWPIVCESLNLLLPSTLSWILIIFTPLSLFLSQINYRPYRVFLSSSNQALTEHKRHLDIPHDNEASQKSKHQRQRYGKRKQSSVIILGNHPILLLLLQEGSFGHYTALPYFVFSSLAHESLNCL